MSHPWAALSWTPNSYSDGQWLDSSLDSIFLIESCRWSIYISVSDSVSPSLLWLWSLWSLWSRSFWSRRPAAKELPCRRRCDRLRPRPFRSCQGGGPGGQAKELLHCGDLDLAKGLLRCGCCGDHCGDGDLELFCLAKGAKELKELLHGGDLDLAKGLLRCGDHCGDLELFGLATGSKDLLHGGAGGDLDVAKGLLRCGDHSGDSGDLELFGLGKEELLLILCWPPGDLDPFGLRLRRPSTADTELPRDFSSQSFFSFESFSRSLEICVYPIPRVVYWSTFSGAATLFGLGRPGKIKKFSASTW